MKPKNAMVYDNFLVHNKNFIVLNIKISGYSRYFSQFLKFQDFPGFLVFLVTLLT